MTTENKGTIIIDLFDSINNQLSIYCFEKDNENESNSSSPVGRIKQKIVDSLSLILNVPRPTSQRHEFILRPEPFHCNQSNKTISLINFSLGTDEKHLSQIQQDQDKTLVFLHECTSQEDVLSDALRVKLLKVHYLAEKYGLSLHVLILVDNSELRAFSLDCFEIFSKLRVIKQTGGNFENNRLVQLGNIHIILGNELYDNNVWYELSQDSSIPLWLNKLKNNLTFQYSSQKPATSELLTNEKQWLCQALKNRVLFSSKS